MPHETSGRGGENFSFVYVAFTFVGYRIVKLFHLKGGMELGGVVLRPVEGDPEEQICLHSELFAVASCLSAGLSRTPGWGVGGTDW